jgi:tetratricopeptide (TPR) repeat protein
MGMVVSAFDPELDRKVALKLVLPSRRAGPSARARLLREAQAMARLSHPHVVAVYDVGAVGDRVWIAMEFVAGRTLTRWLAERPHAWHAIVDMFLQAGDGLQAAHAAGLVHRDFKPDNVMIGGDGRARVMDFGLARAELDAEVDARAGGADGEGQNLGSRLAGTPRYMAPEQWEGRPADAQADQFAFCVALWEALHGEPPFGRGNVPELVTAVLAGVIREPPTRAAVPWWVRRALRRGLSREPGQRWSSMAALMRALDRRPRQRRFAALAIVAAVGAGIAGWLQSPRGDACEAAAGAIAAVWGDDQRLAIGGAFRATGLVYAQDAAERVARDLDEYAQAWSVEAASNCVAGSDSQHRRELVQLCLERRRGELRALVEVLAAGKPEVVENARQAVLRLSPPASCRDPRLAEIEASLPLAEDPVAVGVLRERLARIAAEESAGLYDAAFVDVVALTGDAAALAYAPLVAEVALRRGSILARRGEHEAADAALLEAVAVAERVGHDLVRAAAMVDRLEVVGYLLARPAEMRSWIPVTTELVLRVQPDSPLAARLSSNLAMMALRSYAFSEAEQHQRRALALLERLDAAEGPEALAGRLNLGVILWALNRRAEAREVLERAEEIVERTQGPDHPALARIYIASANVSTDVASGVAYYEKARDLGERVFGPNHPTVASAIANLADIRVRSGAVEAGLADWRRALDICLVTHGDAHTTTAQYTTGLAEALVIAGRLAEAREAYVRAEAIYERTPGDPETALAVAGLANTYAITGQWEQAHAHYHRANELMARRAGELPRYSAESLNGEAKALIELGRPAEAAAVARRVIADAARFGPGATGQARFTLARSLLALGKRAAAGVEAEAARVELEEGREAPFAALDATIAELDAWLAALDPTVSRG